MASYGPVYGRTGQYGQGVWPLKGQPSRMASSEDLRNPNLLWPNRRERVADMIDRIKEWWRMYRMGKDGRVMVRRLRRYYPK